MSSSAAPSGAHRLYSQVEPDSRGNFAYEGDLYSPGLDLVPLTAGIEAHLQALIAGISVSVRGERFAGGRKVLVDLLDGPVDLSDPTARHLFETMLRDQVERFGFTRSNMLTDYLTCAFFTEVRIGQGYWAALAAKRGAANRVEPVVSLSAFKKRVQAGDRMTLVAAPAGHRSLGTTRTVIAVRSADLIFEGPSYLTFPRAAAFACDGHRVRIGIGSEREPDAHLLYEWLREAA